MKHLLEGWGFKRNCIRCEDESLNASACVRNAYFIEDGQVSREVLEGGSWRAMPAQVTDSIRHHIRQVPSNKLPGGSADSAPWLVRCSQLYGVLLTSPSYAQAAYREVSAQQQAGNEIIVAVIGQAIVQSSITDGVMASYEYIAMGG